MSDDFHTPTVVLCAAGIILVLMAAILGIAVSLCLIFGMKSWFAVRLPVDLSTHGFLMIASAVSIEKIKKPRR